ncbi:uncharacterized protein WCC33_012883 isoform 2-T3 [Rhinophrynus dorsalis]
MKKERPHTSAVNFFAESPSSSEDEIVQKKKKKAEEASVPLPTPVSCVRLPAPLLGSQSTTNSGGVFSNPFHEEQQAQLNILEKHVKLSDCHWARGGRGVCLSYQRDGRCRFGTRCKYSHGSDLPQGRARLVQKGVGTIVLSDGEHGEIQRGRNAVLEEEPGEQEEETSQRWKRKKPGLSNNLIPPKKSLKNYQHQVANERPWAL